MVELRTHPQPKGRDRIKPLPKGARASALPDNRWRVNDMVCIPTCYTE